MIAKTMRGLMSLSVILLLLTGCISDPYYKALEEGDMEVVRSVVEGDPDEAQRIFPDGASPLHVAARLDRFRVIRYLLESGADPNFRTPDGVTPLMLSYPNEASWLRDFFAEGFPEDRQLEAAEYALLLVETMRRIDERAAALRTAGGDSDNAALILLSAGAELNAVDAEGKNALWYLLPRHAPVTFQLLLASGTRDVEPCLERIEADMEKIRTETFGWEDLSSEDQYQMEYAGWDSRSTVRFIAFSRQLSLALIDRELKRRAGN